MKNRSQEIGDKNVIECGFSSDGCVFQSWKKRTYTPNVIQMLNLPPSVRTSFGGMVMLAVFPPKVKNYKLFYNTVLEHNRQLWLKTATGPGKGLLLYDSHLKCTSRWYLRICWIVEDSRGLPNPTGSKQAPAITGACPLCCIRGSRLSTSGDNSNKATTYYPGAVCYCNDVAKKEVLIFIKYLLFCRYIWYDMNNLFLRRYVMYTVENITFIWIYLYVCRYNPHQAFKKEFVAVDSVLNNCKRKPQKMETKEAGI